MENIKDFPVVRLALLGVLEVLKKDTNCLHKLWQNPYKIYKNKKQRIIEEPCEEIVDYQKIITKVLQKEFERPDYCYSGWKMLNNIKNAEQHLNQLETITMDISHFYPNTKEKFIRKFFKEEIGLSGVDLELILKITSYNDHLPTGASTSSILSTLVHKTLFDTIYEKMKKQEIKFTLYVDDMTLSANKHISDNCIKYIKNVLNTHALFLKSAKIKRFGYKGALITGTKTTQSGELQVRFKAGHEVVEMLRAKKIADMSVEELQSLIAKIGYINQFQKKQFITTKNIAVKQLKKLHELSRKENENA